jgi:alkyl sulfatase BDS1-like metallo-beta-lactamase superfamily hydrolase
VAAIGGVEKVVELAGEAFEAGDYRWVVELVGQAVFADPGNHAVRGVLADAYEQLGYQSEGPQWRNIYLTAAQELRDGIPTTGVQSTGSVETVMAMPLDLFLDYVAVRLNGPEVADTAVAVNLWSHSAVLPACHRPGRSGIFGRTFSAIPRRAVSFGRAPDALHTVISQ